MKVANQRFSDSFICHGDTFTDADLKVFQPAVYSNTIQCMKTLIENSSQISGCQYSDSIEPQVNMIMDPNLRVTDTFPRTLADAIKIVWKDAGIKKCWQHRSEFQIFDSASYFFDHVQDLTAHNFVPSVEQMLRCRVRTSGIVEAKFDIDGSEFHVFDVGDSAVSERNGFTALRE